MRRWDDSSFVAAQCAATVLNADVQGPEADKSRLRWPANDGLIVNAMRQGILNVAQGVLSSIRHPAAQPLKTSSVGGSLAAADPQYPRSLDRALRTIDGIGHPGLDPGLAGANHPPQWLSESQKTE
jgi:hypothetical protein